MHRIKKGWKVCRVFRDEDIILFGSLMQGQATPDIFPLAPAIMDQSLRMTDMVDLPFLYEKGFRTKRYPMFGPLALYDYQCLDEAINVIRRSPVNKAILECNYLESDDILTWFKRGMRSPVVFGFNNGIGTRYADWVEPKRIFLSGEIRKLQEEYNHYGKSKGSLA